MRAYVEPLIGVCVDYLEHNPDDNLEKTNVYSALFQDETPVSGKLEKVFVEAQKLIRQYLLAKYYFREQNEFYQTFDFAEIARVKGLEGKYKQSMTRLIQMQEQAPAKNAIHFHQQFQLETAIHYVESIENQYRGDINIPNVLHATEMYYQIRKVTLLSRYLLQLKVAKLETPEMFNQMIHRYLLLVDCDYNWGLDQIAKEGPWQTAQVSPLARRMYPLSPQVAPQLFLIVQADSEEPTMKTP